MSSPYRRVRSRTDESKPRALHWVEEGRPVGPQLDKLFEEARRQSLLVSRRRSERETLEFIEQTADTSMEDDFSMRTIVTQKNKVTIPAEVRRKLGIKPGWRLDWQPVEGKEEILIRVIPDRGELTRRLLGASRKLSPDRDAVAEFVAERTGEG